MPKLRNANRALMGLFAIVLVSAAPMAHAGTMEPFQTTLRKGDIAIYERSNDGNPVRFSMTYKGVDGDGNHKFTKKRVGGGGSGRTPTILYTPYMAFLESRKVNIKPHAARMPIVEVGTSWGDQQTVRTRGEAKRTINETCRSVELAPFTIPSGMVFDAIKIMCSASRVNGGSWDTTSWFDTRTGLELSFEQTWDGGGKWARMLEFRPKN